MHFKWTDDGSRGKKKTTWLKRKRKHSKCPEFCGTWKFRLPSSPSREQRCISVVCKFITLPVALAARNSIPDFTAAGLVAPLRPLCPPPPPSVVGLINFVSTWRTRGMSLGVGGGGGGTEKPEKRISLESPRSRRGRKVKTEVRVCPAGKENFPLFFSPVASSKHRFLDLLRFRDQSARGTYGSAPFYSLFVSFAQRWSAVERFADFPRWLLYFDTCSQCRVYGLRETRCTEWEPFPWGNYTGWDERMVRNFLDNSPNGAKVLFLINLGWETNIYE